jgi:HEAT repeat protein
VTIERRRYAAGIFACVCALTVCQAQPGAPTQPGPVSSGLIQSGQNRPDHVDPVPSSISSNPVQSSQNQTQQGDPVALAIAQLKDSDHVVRYRAAMALVSEKDARAVEPLIAALNDKDDSVRAAAATALGLQGDGRAIDPLVAMLANKDEKNWAREEACKSLGNLKAAPAIPALIRMMGSKDFGMQNDASDALAKIGEPAVEPLITALGDASATRRRRAVTTLMVIKDPRAVEPIIGVLHDPNEEVRYWSAGALGELGDKRAADPLADLAGKTGDMARGPAFSALVKLHDSRAVDFAIAALNDPDGRVGGWAATSLKESRDPRAIPPLLAFLQQPQCWPPYRESENHRKDGRIQPGYARCQAMDALISLHDVAHPVTPVVDAMLAGLHDCAACMRYSATAALGDFGGSRAVEPLIALLDDKDSNVSNAAVVSLGKLKDRRAVEPLIAHLSANDGISNGVNTAQALGQIGDPRAIPPLLAALRAAKDDYRRDGFATALGQIGKPAVPSLLALLKDPDEKLRVAAAEALAAYANNHDDARVKRTLDAALKENDLIIVSGADLYFLKHQDSPAVAAALLASLDKRGDLRIANDLFHNGNEQLKQAAIAWGSKRGYMVLGNGAGERWLGPLMD